MQCIDVLARWSVDGTALSCVAELRPGPATIRMPCCRLAGDVVSCADSEVELGAWKEASVETDWRGTRVELTYDYGAVVLADYDLVEA